jgi:RNA cap guanine-N2 methyltransferase
MASPHEQGEEHSKGENNEDEEGKREAITKTQPPKETSARRSHQIALNAHAASDRAPRTLCLRVFIGPEDSYESGSFSSSSRGGRGGGRSQNGGGRAVGDPGLESVAKARAEKAVRVCLTADVDSGEGAGAFEIDVIRPPAGGYRSPGMYLWSRGDTQTEIPVEVVFTDQQSALMVFRALEAEAERTGYDSRRPQHKPRGASVAPSPSLRHAAARPDLRCLTEFCFEPSKRDYFWPFVEPGLRSQMRLDEEAVYSVTEQGTSDVLSAMACVLLGVWPLRAPLPPVSTPRDQVDPSESPGFPFVMADATACVGGNALSFARFFPDVRAAEIDAERCELLRENVQLLGLDSRVRCLSVDWYESLGSADTAADAVFLDPPWGGIDYRNAKSVPITLGPTPMRDCVQRLRARHPRTRLVMMKLPLNGDLTPFEEWSLAQDDPNATSLGFHMCRVRFNKILVLIMDFASTSEEFATNMSRCIAGRSASPYLESTTSMSRWSSWECFVRDSARGKWIDATKRLPYASRASLYVPAAVALFEPSQILFPDELLILRRRQKLGSAGVAAVSSELRHWNYRVQNSPSVLPASTSPPRFWEPSRLSDERGHMRSSARMPDSLGCAFDDGNALIFRALTGGEGVDGLATRTVSVLAVTAAGLSHVVPVATALHAVHICDSSQITAWRGSLDVQRQTILFVGEEPGEADKPAAAECTQLASTPEALRSSLIARLEAELPKCDVFTVSTATLLEIGERDGASSAERALPGATEALFSVVAFAGLCLGVGSGASSVDESAGLLVVCIRSLADYHMCELFWLLTNMFEAVSVCAPDHADIGVAELVVRASRPRIAEIGLRSTLRRVLTSDWDSKAASLIARESLTSDFIGEHCRAAGFFGELRRAAVARSVNKTNPAVASILQAAQSQVREAVLGRLPVRTVTAEAADEAQATKRPRSPPETPACDDAEEPDRKKGKLDAESK